MTAEYFFHFINLALRKVWIQNFELPPIMCKQQNAFDSKFNSRYPSKEGQLQLYKFVNYKKCGKTFQIQYANNGAKPQTKQMIIKMSLNGSSIRDISRVLNISTNTAMSVLKKQKNSKQT